MNEAGGAKAPPLLKVGAEWGGRKFMVLLSLFVREKKISCTAIFAIRLLW